METSLEVVQSQQISIFASSPEQTIKFATEIANALVPVINQQKMFVVIQGKRHVKIEAWLTLGAIVGILPREVGVKEHADGSYEAQVDLVNRDGRVVGGASALCGIEEKRWDKAERYARRSMATTRATAKAYRLAFSWLIQLSGFEPTPAEEMTGIVIDSPKPVAKAPAKPVGFDPNNKTHIDAMAKALAAKQVPEDLWDQIGNAMRGKSMTELDAVIAGQNEPKA